MSKPWFPVLSVALSLASAVPAVSSTAASADPLYQSLPQARLSGPSLSVAGLRLRKDVVELLLEQGTLQLAEPADGRNRLAVFEGRGRMLLTPATEVERHHLGVPQQTCNQVQIGPYPVDQAFAGLCEPLQLFRRAGGPSLSQSLFVAFAPRFLG